MINNPNNTHEIFSSRVKLPATQFIGDPGRIFYHEDTGELRISDGKTPHGFPIFTSGNATISVSLLGDVTGTGPAGGINTTLASVNTDIGTFGSTTSIPIITVNDKGLITSVSTATISASVSGNIILDGDVTAIGTTGANTTVTLKTVNSNTGTFGNATYTPVITVNGKGLITSLSTIATAGSGAVSGNIILDGDVVAIGTTGANTTVALNAVNSNVGTFGTTTVVPVITVNGKGLITSVSTATIAAGSLILYAENGTPAVSPAAVGGNSVALGDGALTSVYGGLTHSAGNFSLLGDAQTGNYVARGITTDGVTWVELLLNGSSERLTLAQNTSMSFVVTLVGRDVAVAGQVAIYELRGGISKGVLNSSTRIIGLISKTVVATDTHLWDVRASANTSNGALRIEALGYAGKTIRWVAYVRTVEVRSP